MSFNLPKKTQKLLFFSEGLTSDALCETLNDPFAVFRGCLVKGIHAGEKRPCTGEFAYFSPGVSLSFMRFEVEYIAVSVLDDASSLLLLGEVEQFLWVELRGMAETM